MEEKKIDLWDIEGQILAKIDSMNLREDLRYHQRFLIDNWLRCDISISSKNGVPVIAQQKFNSDNIDFSLNLGSGSFNSFQADNQGGHNYIHLHFISGSQQFDKDRIPFPETTSVTSLISEIFNKAEEIVGFHFPNVTITSRGGFVGPA